MLMTFKKEKLIKKIKDIKKDIKLFSSIGSAITQVNLGAPVGLFR